MKRSTIIGIIIFAIAMAALESAVVVYLRALYYPAGFTVAFKLIDVNILMIEIAREAATLVMIASIAYMAGNNYYQRIAAFLLCFAVWDIFYYVWLKIFIDWPSSFFDWDILFLIPITWLGPVLAPVICSVTMIVLAAIMMRKEIIRIPRLAGLSVLSGGFIILCTFVWDYVSLLVKNEWISEFFSILENKEFIATASSYLPTTYYWPAFLAGELLILAGIWLMCRTMNRVQ